MKTCKKKMNLSFMSIFSQKIFYGNMDDICEFIVNLKNTNKTANIILPISLNDFYWISSSINILRAYKKIDFMLPDGMPLVLSIRKSHKNTDRIYGPMLMYKILLSLSGTNTSHVFFGSSEKTINLLEEKINKISILKKKLMISPPYRKFSYTEEKKYLKTIKAFNPDFLWIGLSSPNQVILASKWKHKFPNTTILCVGAAFDFMAETKKQAPQLMQNIGLEWLFRLITEPKRLYKRYLFNIPFFLVRHLLSNLDG